MRVTGNLALKLVAAVSSSAILILSPLASAADKVVHSVEELDDTLHDRTFSGRVIIPKDSVWFMERCDKKKDEFGNFICTPVLELPIYSGVTLIGERGELGSRPLLFTTLVDKAAKPRDVRGLRQRHSRREPALEGAADRREPQHRATLFPRHPRVPRGG